MYENRSLEISYKLIRNVVLIAVVITVISVVGKASANGMRASVQQSASVVEAR